MKSLLYPLLLFIAFIALIVFLEVSEHSDSTEIDLVTVIIISGITVSVLFIPNIILFAQYYSENKKLKYNIKMSSSSISIENGKRLKSYSFEDIVISKIYLPNYKRSKFSGPYELFYRNFGYWYLLLNTGEEYRITSLIADMEFLPTICDTDLIYVAIPTFKKEKIDQDRDFEQKIAKWKRRFNHLSYAELKKKKRFKKYLDKCAIKAIDILIEEKKSD